MDQIECLSIRFALLTHGSLKAHANAVYQLYQESITVEHPKGYRSILDNTVLDISTIEQSILQHEDIILKTVGVGKEMKWVRVVLEPVHILITWLEEILLEAMISPTSLKDKYLNRELAFQK